MFGVLVPIVMCNVKKKKIKEEKDKLPMFCVACGQRMIPNQKQSILPS